MPFAQKSAFTAASTAAIRSKVPYAPSRHRFYSTAYAMSLRNCCNFTLRDHPAAEVVFLVSVMDLNLLDCFASVIAAM